MRAELLRTISPRRERIASAVSGSIVKSSRAASATARSMRTGSSRKRTRGVADGADHARRQVLEPAHPVDHREVRDVVEERVHREVAAERVLLGGAEGVVAADQGVALLGLRRAAEGGDLDHLAAEAHVREAEAAARR